MELARLFVKYKWLVFAMILIWSFALVGRIFIEKASAATIWSPENTSYVDVNLNRSIFFQEFTAAGPKYNKLKVRWASGGGIGATSTISICSGEFTAWNTCSLVRMEQIAGQAGASSTDSYTEYYFASAFDTTPGNKYFFKIENPPDWIKNNYAYASHDGGGWNAGGSSLYTVVDLQFAIGYDDDLSDSDSEIQDVRIYDNPFLDRHHLEVPALQWCANDGTPCQVAFSFNEYSWDSGIKIYNDGENGTYTGSALASTTALDFFPKMEGTIDLPYTATTSEGYDYFCLRLYNAYGTYPDEITCGIKVMFLNPGTLQCAWDKATYEVENDYDTVCDGIATSSVWEVGSWPGAMECAGRKVSWYLFTASSTDYYNLCQAVNKFNNRFPMSLYYGIKNEINNWAAIVPTTSSAPLVPMIWNNASTSVDLFPVNRIKDELPIWNTIYDWLEIAIWLYAFWIIVSDLFGITMARQGITKKEYELAREVQHQQKNEQLVRTAARKWK